MIIINYYFMLCIIYNYYVSTSSKCAVPDKMPISPIESDDYNVLENSNYGANASEEDDVGRNASSLDRK